MKIKKLVPLLALVMGISAFGGCTNNDQKIIFIPLWNEHSNADKEVFNETLTYGVTFESAESSYVNYTLDYKDGVYTTNLVGEVVNGELVYTYTTALSITPLFTFEGKTTDPEWIDTVTSEVKFKATNYGLQPISSKKSLVNHTPVGNSVTALEECYRYYHYTLETTYLNDCTSGKTVITSYPLKEDGTADKPIPNEYEFEIDQDKFSYLDNEQLLAAVRCIRNATTSAKVNVYSPFVNTVQKVSITFNADASKEFTLNGETKTITYRPVSIVLDEQNPGTTQVAWIAKYEEVNGVNKNRNVMLYLETPLSYNLGTMKYTLQSMNYTK